MFKRSRYNIWVDNMLFNSAIVLTLNLLFALFYVFTESESMMECYWMTFGFLIMAFILVFLQIGICDILFNNAKLDYRDKFILDNYLGE